MNTTALIILGGFAGAGKSTVARRLSSESNLPLLSSDDFIEAVKKTFGKAFHDAAPAAYDILWHITETHLKNGVSVILDSNMCSERTWKNVDAIKNQFPHVRVLPIILECSLEVHKERIEKRGLNEPEHFNLGGDTFESILFKYEFIRDLNRNDLVKIDASRSSDEVYDDICAITRETVLKKMPVSA